MTKIFMLLAIAVSTSFSVSAQPSKGTVLLGGSLSFDHSKATNATPAKSTSFRFSPAISKFYKDNRLVGGGISYSHATGNQIQNGYGINVFLRQYLPLGKAFYLFADEGAYGRISRGKYKNAQAPRQENATSAGITFYPGMAYGINKKLQLEIGMPDMATLYYNHYETKDTGAPSNNSTTNSVGFSTGLSELFFGTLSFGIRVALN